MADGLDDADILREIADRARDAGVRVQRVSRDRLDAEARTTAPQGVLAAAFVIHLSYVLIRPALPLLAGLIFIFAILWLVGWYRGRW